MHDLDFVPLAIDAGFRRENAFVTETPSGLSNPVRRTELKAGDFGNVGRVMVFGATN
jgi:hypothetical protein